MAVAVAGVALPPCTTDDNLLDLHVLLEPPTAIEGDGSFDVELLAVHGDQLRAVGFQGRLVDPDTVEAALVFQSIPTADCSATVLWSAQLPGPATPTPTSTAATVAPATPTPTSTSAAAALPSAGQGGDAGSQPWLLVVLVAAAAAVAGSALLRRVLR
jgi:hypothetical protein